MAHSPDLQLPEALRDGVMQHLDVLREHFKRRQWGNRVGFGRRPAVIVIDLAKAWTDPKLLIGTNLDSVVAQTRMVLDAARAAGLPIFYTVVGYTSDDPPVPSEGKKPGNRGALALQTDATELDPRLGRRPHEKLIVKKYASCFKGTDLQEMLSALGVDTLIVTGCSTLHCVYATCVDASSGYRVIVPAEAVGDRCELFHLVGLLDIDLTKGDVMPVRDVVQHIKELAPQRNQVGLR
jgi:nicotinamidase-related amidase